MSKKNPTPAKRRRAKHEEPEEHVNHERWLVSYSDMITVLMALFIVLYAISQVDVQKFDALSESLAEGFNNSKSILDGTDGTQDGVQTAPTTEPVPDSTNPVVPPTLASAARTERTHLEGIRADLLADLQTQGLDTVVRFQIDERGLVLGLVADDVFFDPASAILKPTALAVVNTSAPTLAALKEQISVEGHANNVPVNTERYPTNWELSADRATQVLRELVERGGVPSSRVRATGFGDSRPLDGAGTNSALAANRRVDLVILSDAPEAVRALLPAATSTEG